MHPNIQAAAAASQRALPPSLNRDCRGEGRWKQHGIHNNAPNLVIIHARPPKRTRQA
jgi:hypothetical protein